MTIHNTTNIPTSGWLEGPHCVAPTGWISIFIRQTEFVLGVLGLSGPDFDFQLFLS